LIAGSQNVDAGIAQLGSLQLAAHDDSRVTNLVVRVIELPVVDGALGLDYLSRFRSVCHDFESHLLELTTR